MSGIKYLLDTNFILGLLSARPEVLSEIATRKLLVSQCAYSAITYMEILGFHGIAATAIAESLTLLTMDKHLQTVVASANSTP